MDYNQHNQPAGERDPETWEIAKRRVSFKNHLATYIVINAFLWAIWYFYSDGDHGYWPIYSTLGWGIGLMFHFLGAYVFPKENSVEREYEKLMRNKK
jgi:hypothetical protein